MLETTYIHSWVISGGKKSSFTEGSARMSQNASCKSILVKFSMTNCNPQNTPCVANLIDEMRFKRNSPQLDNPTPLQGISGFFNIFSIKWLDMTYLS